MKNLNAQDARILNVMVKKSIAEIDAAKKENLQKEIIAKFGEEHFKGAIAKIEKSNLDALKKSNVPAKAKKEISALENVLAQSGLDKKITSDLLLKLSAIGITEKIKENGAKSIFKKKFNNKTDRTTCRSKFLNAIQLYLLNVAHNKAEIANQQLIKINEIACKYYLAENKFANVSDYASNNMDANKKASIELFIDLQKSIAVKNEKSAKRNAKKVEQPA